MKLEIKHLTSYLPYGLKGFCTDDLQGVEIMNGLQKISDSCIEVISDKEPMDLIYFKPILFPLSKYYSEKNGYGGYIAFKDFKNEVINKRISLKVYEDLLKNKFDVFGLIEAGLAEPVTEDFNPYK